MMNCLFISDKKDFLIQQAEFSQGDKKGEIGQAALSSVSLIKIAFIFCSEVLSQWVKVFRRKE